MMTRSLKNTALGLLLGFGLTSCGYSEDEWQAQLARYGQLESQHAEEKKAHAATQEELAKTQQRVRDLEEELRRQGVDVEQLNQKLQQEGTEKERLAADLDQLQRALEEYKQRAAQLERIKQRFEQLRSKLQKLTTLGLKVQIRHNRMVISLPGDILFASGKDELRAEGKPVLSAVADVIRTDSQLNARYFQVAGHTDNKPLKYNVKFIDNWGLSAMRARQVLVYLISPVEAKDGGGGLNAQRLHAAGYGETDPVAPNDTDANLQANRRVELVLLPDVEEMLDLKSLL
jgi:chemotaxis protein MotB